MSKPNRDVVMTVRVTEQEAELLREAADKHSVSLSQLIRGFCFRAAPRRSGSVMTTASNAHSAQFVFHTDGNMSV